MSRSSGVNWDGVPYSKYTDGELAAALGVCRTTVARNRRRRGATSAHPRTRIDWGHVGDLGLVPDDVLAERLGVTVSQVSEARRWRGIEAPPAACLVCAAKLPRRRSSSSRS